MVVAPQLVVLGLPLVVSTVYELEAEEPLGQAQAEAQASLPLAALRVYPHPWPPPGPGPPPWSNPGASCS